MNPNSVPPMPIRWWSSSRSTNLRSWTVADQTLDELTPLSINLTGSDVDVPANTLTYSLVSGPAGMNVSSGGL